MIHQNVYPGDNDGNIPTDTKVLNCHGCTHLPDGLKILWCRDCTRLTHFSEKLPNGLEGL
jgi:hypothetical protein